MPTIPEPPAGTRIQSLERGLRILELVARSPEGLSLGELSRLMSLGKTTVHNLARTLVVTGYLDQRRDPIRYVPGPALFALVGRQRLHALHERAAPVLLELSAEFAGMPVLLAESAGTEVRVALRVSGEHPGVIERPLDRFSPPYANPTSLLFLAFWNDDERRAFNARHPFWEQGAHLWASEEALQDYLGQVRTQRYATRDQAQGLAFPIAVPLFSERGELLAALGLAYRSTGKITTATKQRLIKRVRAAADQIVA